MKIDIARLIAIVESPLLLGRKASHTLPGDQPFIEPIRRVVEVTTTDVGLLPVSFSPEDDRVKVHPAAARSNQLDPNRMPVGLYTVAAAFQRPKRG